MKRTLMDPLYIPPGFLGGVYLGGRNIKQTHCDFINKLLRFCLGTAPTIIHLWLQLALVTSPAGQLGQGDTTARPLKQAWGYHCWVVDMGSVLLGIDIP